MEYDNSAVRRQDRLLEESDALRLLREGEYGVLSFCDGNTASRSITHGMEIRQFSSTAPPRGENSGYWKKIPGYRSV